MNAKKLISIICILGIISTLYLTYAYYFGSDICNVNEFISCNKIISSEYSKILNTPLSILGLIYFIMILVLVNLNFNIKYLSYLSVPVLFYSFYLTYIEIFILKGICLGCEITKILVIAIIAVPIFKWKYL